jgi:hypothetical protein
VVGWISLFTLHVLWPFLWIWATLYREDRGWGFSDGKSSDEHVRRLEGQVSDLAARLAALEEGSEALAVTATDVPPTVEKDFVTHVFLDELPVSVSLTVGRGVIYA